VLSIVGEGGETVDLFEDTQVQPSALNVLEAAEGLLVLGEDTDHLFGGLVGGGDVATLDGIDQPGPRYAQSLP
jgi:hypothetical protein